MNRGEATRARTLVTSSHADGHPNPDGSTSLSRGYEPPSEAGIDAARRALAPGHRCAVAAEPAMSVGLGFIPTTLPDFVACAKTSVDFMTIIVRLTIPTQFNDKAVLFG